MLSLSVNCLKASHTHPPRDTATMMIGALGYLPLMLETASPISSVLFPEYNLGVCKIEDVVFYVSLTSIYLRSVQKTLF